MIFEHAYSQAPPTVVSHATILTGTYPQTHRVSEFGSRLASALPFVPDLLRAAGIALPPLSVRSRLIRKMDWRRVSIVVFPFTTRDFNRRSWSGPKRFSRAVSGASRRSGYGLADPQS